MADESTEVQLKEITQELKEVGKHIAQINVTTAKQQVALDEHIKRTALAEENISLLRESVEPIKKHVAMVEGALKAFGLIGLAISMMAGLLKILSFFGVNW